jgi:hypothetical protein
LSHFSRDKSTPEGKKIGADHGSGCCAAEKRFVEGKGDGKIVCCFLIFFPPVVTI